jgi:hypothetical protein
MSEVKSATILEDEPGYFLTPEMPGVPPFKVRINTCTPSTFWQFAGQVPIVEVTNVEEVAKRYFKVPFYFFNPKTGNLTLIEDSLAQVAHLICKPPQRTRDWGKIIGYEEV